MLIDVVALRSLPTDVIPVSPMIDAVDPELLKRLERGEYVVDARAVAEAMLRRRADARQVADLSRVLVPPEPEADVVPLAKRRPKPPPDVS